MSERPASRILGELALVLGTILLTLRLLDHVLSQYPSWTMLVWLLPPIALAAMRREDASELLGLIPQRLGSGLVAALVLCAVVLPAYALVVTSWRAAAQPDAGGLAMQLPSLDVSQTGRIFVIHLLLVALPEEAFFRGYMMTRLLKAFPDKRGQVASLLVQALLFGVAHVALTGDVSRLDTALPALLFGALRLRSGDIWGAVIFHAACNAVAAGLGSAP